MSLITERWRRMVGNIFHTKSNYSPIGVVPDVSTEEGALQKSISETAHRIAENVRTQGEQKFGPMWAQGYTVLPDGRTAFLQQSLGDAKVSEALVINIPPTADDSYSTHIRYDLRRNGINTYEVQSIDGKPIIAYWKYDRPVLGTRIPPRFTLRNIIGPVGEILQLVEIASNNIMWTEPERTPVVALG